MQATTAPSTATPTLFPTRAHGPASHAAANRPTVREALASARRHTLVPTLCALLALLGSGLHAADAPARPAAASGAQASAPQAAANAANARVEAAYVRGLPPGQRVTSAYFTLKNLGATPLRLIGASSPRAGRVELHAHEMRDGMARMRKRDFVDVPANGNVRFAPGGLHLMLFDLQGTLVDRELVSITLRFEGGAQLPLTLPVCSVMRTSCP